MAHLFNDSFVPDDARREPLAEGDVVDCPECGGAATVEWAFTLGSTSGPVDHVRISCPSRHHFLMPAEGLAWEPWIASRTCRPGSLPGTFLSLACRSVPGKSEGSPAEGARSSVSYTNHNHQEIAMYHPMLSLAVAQTRLDDLNRDLSRPRTPKRQRRAAGSATPAQQPTSVRSRIAQYAGRRPRPTAA